MKKGLFIVSTFCISFVIQYLLIANMFNNMDFSFGGGVSLEQLFLALLPVITMIIVSIILGVCGRHIFKAWRKKDQLVVIAAPITSTVVAFAIFIVLHP